ncbi:MAG: hypothetical protein ACE5IM_04570, partial [Nitrospinota bacterium]
SILTYQSAIRAVNGPGGSKVAGKVKFCAVPGSLVQGGPFRRALQVNGFAWMINRYGRYPEAAYWLIQWLTSGQVSANLAARPGSGFSPTQAGHFEQPKVVGALTPELTAILAKLTQVAVPEMLLVGADRYHEALDRNLFAALAGEISPEEAMKRTADAWETITEEVGRKRQREAWRGFLQRLPKKDVPD